MALAFLSDTGIAVVAVLVVVIFGGSQLPKLARNLGMAGKEFRKAHDDAEKESAAAAAAAPPAPSALASSPADEQITISRSELEAFLAERDAKAKGQTNS